MAIYVYFFLYLKNRSTNSHHFGCVNINGYYTTKYQKKNILFLQ